MCWVYVWDRMRIERQTEVEGKERITKDQYKKSRCIGTEYTRCGPGQVERKRQVEVIWFIWHRTVFWGGSRFIRFQVPRHEKVRSNCTVGFDRG